MRALKLLALLVIIHAVTGCTTYSLQELRSTTPKGTPFQAALAVKYLRFAEEEAANYDWVDSAYFADKGLVAAYGDNVAPEQLSAWDIPEDKRAELEAARASGASAFAGTP